MENNKDNLYVEEEFTQEDLRLIRGCLLTTKETLKFVPTKDIQNKLKEIEKLLLKFKSGT